MTRQQRNDEARGRRAMALAAIIGALFILLTMVLPACTTNRRAALDVTCKVQAKALLEYVKTANQAIDRDQTLTAKDREDWQAVGVKLIVLHRDIQELIRKTYGPGTVFEDQDQDK